MPAPQMPESPVGEIMDPEWYPVLPEPPNSALDIVGWFGYLIDIIIYVFQLVAFLFRALVLGIGNLITGTSDLLLEIAKTLSFLPTEMIVFITLSITLLVLIKVIKRGN